MTTHLGLQRIMIPGSQASALTTGNITLTGARRSGASIPVSVSCLVVAGGGSGGYDRAAGGGGGGFRTGTVTIGTGTPETVTVGAGGTAPNAGSLITLTNSLVASFVT